MMSRNKDIFQVLSSRQFYPAENNCIGNAGQAALLWHMDTGKIATIHNVVLPHHGPHAYLATDDQPHSHKVTWPTHFFPEYESVVGLSFLPQHTDITLHVLVNMLASAIDSTQFNSLAGIVRDPDINTNLHLVPPEHIYGWQEAIFTLSVCYLESINKRELAELFELYWQPV